jgi:energy-coupling factor transporter ATP-binding protein EcfA2
MSHFSLKHLSARVPWHDAGWSGTVCNAPHLNGSCTKLKGISESKNTASEIPYAGISLLNISPSNWPCCVNERMAFMAPFDLNVLKKHALARNSKPPYGHFKPTLQRNPPYSLGIVPFRWMMRENLRAIGADYDLTIQPEPELGYKSNWVTGVGNQKTVLGAFTDHLRTQHSICLIYAKNVPFYEDSGRILVGVGRVTHIGELTQYNHDGSGMDGYIWERPVQHSIRPSGEDGFLMPYHELLVLQEKDSSLDMARYVAKAPEEHWDEFSYASELVTHDGAIAALLSLDRALVLIEKEQGINTSAKQKWIHNELVRLWAVRGPYPGMGAVLTAFGLSRGVFVAHALQDKAGENVNPWPLVELTFADPSKILSKELHVDIKELAPTWIGLPTERKAYLKLLSRFNLTVEQARLLYDETIRKKKGWLATDGDILRNPYRLYELTRLDLDGVPLMIIDRGIFPDDTVRLKHPLDQPSVLESAVDVRRIRAFSIAILENAAEVGHTLLPAEHIVEAVCQYPISPACPITHDMLVARVNDFLPDITQTESAEQLTFQLERYKTIRDLIRKEVNGRAKGLPLKVTQDWSVLLDKKFGTTIETEELQARSEKAAALKQLAESRFSVLVGPAGAGKTTVLGLLCAQAEIQQGGLLLLAPTGKARVRMQELAQGGGKAMTLAQFLIQNKRYDGKSARYLLNSTPKANGYETVIIDESSMLTEDMLGALFNALEGVKRYILVGDPAQLPPIGAGRPFVDIIEKLKPANVEALFPRIANGYSELTIERRQQGQDRADLRFVRWFSAMQPDVGGDDLFDDNMSVHKNLNFVSWQTHDDFREKLLNVLVDTLDLKDSHDIRGFNRALGAEKNGEYDNFNPSWGKSSSVNSIENWQILSPLRGMPIGVSDINRLIHERFRGNLVDLASRSYNRAIPKPSTATK